MPPQSGSITIIADERMSLSSWNFATAVPV
jgi:hypothetical protein